MNLPLFDPEVASTVVLLVHRRVKCRPFPEICFDLPARSAIRVKGQGDPLATASRTGETGPFLDRAALYQN